MLLPTKCSILVTYLGYCKDYFNTPFKLYIYLLCFPWWIICIHFVCFKGPQIKSDCDEDFLFAITHICDLPFSAPNLWPSRWKRKIISKILNCICISGILNRFDFITNYPILKLYRNNCAPLPEIPLYHRQTYCMAQDRNIRNPSLWLTPLIKESFHAIFFMRWIGHPYKDSFVTPTGELLFSDYQVGGICPKFSIQNIRPLKYLRLISDAYKWKNCVKRAKLVFIWLFCGFLDIFINIFFACHTKIATHPRLSIPNIRTHPKFSMQNLPPLENNHP